MIMALTAKNKLVFIDGSLHQPPAIDPTFQSWTRCNNMVLSWIMNSVSKDIYTSILYITNAEVMWKDLKDHFSQSNGARIFELKKSISALIQGNNSVNAYYTALKGLWDELVNFESIPACTCNCRCTCRIIKKIMENRDRDYIMQFLMGLNDSYSAICGQLLLNDPLPTMNKVFSLIIQEERQRMIKSASVNQNVFQNSAALVSRSPVSSYNSSNTNRNPKQYLKKPTCSHCGVLSHTIEKYYKIHGFPPGFKFTKGKTVGDSSAHQVQVYDDDSSVVIPSVPQFTSEQCQ
jgi:hypothetical protein